MDLSQRKSNWESFMKSKKFGLNTYASLIIFSQNIRTESQGVRSFLSLLDDHRLQMSKISIEPNKLRTKQYLVLVSLNRLLVSSETFLVMCDALSRGYDKVSSSMTFYDFNLLYSIQRKISHRRLNIQNVLGFAKTNTLPLTNVQKHVMWKLYNKSGKEFYKFLDELFEFYDQFRIIFGKSKHGLSLMYGRNLFNPTSFDLENSSLIAFDRRGKNKMPKKTFMIKNKNVKSKIPTWFKSQSIVKFSPKLLLQMNQISKNLEKYSTYITRNHLLKVKNCDLDYLPYDDRNGVKTYGYFPNTKISKNEQKIITKLKLKTVPHTNDIKKGFQYDLTIAPKRILDSLKRNTVTTFFVD